MHLNEAGIDVFITSSRADEKFDPTTGLGGTRVKALERLVRTPFLVGSLQAIHKYVKLLIFLYMGAETRGASSSELSGTWSPVVVGGRRVRCFCYV